ncbi:unnamed protein product [Acanthoscelides obtectus]|uniref:Uncharacterized protein n=1 Tax=Acanthoscelides obtectus TaxID=200917 RepID=A0A9P0Q993_ACAOB|nr:unnamed protein product [Acanthoscelides obtectus]CAK1643675.1 hypothetical protein AOBTE_LOCUS13631 [Acanthoscelides obtectus]
MRCRNKCSAVSVKNTDRHAFVVCQDHIRLLVCRRMIKVDEDDPVGGELFTLLNDISFQMAQMLK